MPGVKSAQQLVQLVRYNCQLISTTQYRDGFPTDAVTTSDLIPILAFVNQSLAAIAMTGVVQTDVPMATVSGQFKYAVPSGAGRIVDVAFYGGGQTFSLVNSTLDNMNQRDRNWRGVFGNPSVYMPLGTEVYLYPVPTTSGPAIFRSPVQPGDLVYYNDIPSQIPPFYHDAIWILAAMMLCASDADNSSRATRLPYLVSLWEQWYPDIDRFVRARTLFNIPQISGFGQMQTKQEGGV